MASENVETVVEKMPDGITNIKVIKKTSGAPGSAFILFNYSFTRNRNGVKFTEKGHVHLHKVLVDEWGVERAKAYVIEKYVR